MRKRLGSPLEQAADALQLRPNAPPPAPGFSELNVTIGQVAAYGDPDAWVWFGFLLARNARWLGPAYGAAGAVAGLLTYAAILVAARALGGRLVIWVLFSISELTPNTRAKQA